MKTVSPGIRQKDNGKFLATKSIGEKRYYQEFDDLKQAKKWKEKFHPLIAPVKTRRHTLPVSDQSNGQNKSICLGEVIEKYQKGFLLSLDPYTQYKKTKRMERFLPNILGYPMCAFTPEIINQHLSDMRLLIERDSRRCNFDKELKDLSSVFNWYKENHDFTFSNPVTKTHFRLGKLKEIMPKKKHLSEDEICQFLNELEEPFHTLAKVQFLMAGRIQEAAALNDRMIDFKAKEITVNEKIVWMKSRPELRAGTKTGEVGTVDIDDSVIENLLSLKTERPKGCKLFFQRKGLPLRYNLILKKYNEALTRAGLEDFTGTHILRHSMAKIVRKEGGLEACQSILRHTSSRMSEHYAKLDANDKVSKVVNIVARRLDKAKSRASSCDRVLVSG
jgi:integrase